MSFETEETSSHDEISALWEEAAKESPETPEVDKAPDKSPELEPEKADGKSAEGAAKEESPEDGDNVADPVEKEDAPEKQEPLLSQDKAPSAWSPKARERWNEIPEDLRSEILRREEASAKGVRQLQEETAPMRGFVQTLAPFIQEAVQNAQDPAQYIGSVMVTERILRTGNVDQKFEALLNIADQYKIPLRQIINESVGEEVLKAAPSQQQYQLPPEIQKELEENRRWREQQSQRSSGNEIAEFAKKNEFFEDLREDMAKLLEAGVASDLQSAYDKAAKLHPEVSEILAERAARGGKTAALKAKQAKAAGAAVNTDESLGEKPPKQNPNAPVEDDIRASIAELSGRA